MDRGPTPARGRSGSGGRRRPGRGSASRCGVRHWKPTYEPSQPQLVERLRPHPLGGQGDLERGPRGRPLVHQVGGQAGQAAPPGPLRRGAAAEDERRGDDRQVAPREDPERQAAPRASATSGTGRRNGRRRGARGGPSGRAAATVVAGLAADDRQADPGPARPGSARATVADRLGRHRLVPLEVGRDPAGVAEVGVVGVEPVGHAAEPADVVQRVDEPGEPAVLDPLQLGLGRRPSSAIAAISASIRSRACSHDRPGRRVAIDAERPGQLAARLVRRRRPAPALARRPACGRAGSTCPRARMSARSVSAASSAWKWGTVGQAR